MKFGNVYQLQPQKMLSGVFRNDMDVYHAREVLTDFGYPKEAANVIVLSGLSTELKDDGQSLARRLWSKPVLGISILGLAAAPITIGTLVGLSYYLEITRSEIFLLFVLWALAMAACTVLCVFIGATVASIISFVAAKEFPVKSEDRPTEEKFLISVAVRNLADAQDIATEWEEIGGHVVQMPTVPATERLAA